MIANLVKYNLFSALKSILKQIAATINVCKRSGFSGKRDPRLNAYAFIVVFLLLFYKEGEVPILISTVL